jgi:hypothetical protein
MEIIIQNFPFFSVHQNSKFYFFSSSCSCSKSHSSSCSSFSSVSSHNSPTTKGKGTNDTYTNKPILDIICLCSFLFCFGLDINLNIINSLILFFVVVFRYASWWSRTVWKWRLFSVGRGFNLRTFN